MSNYLFVLLLQRKSDFFLHINQEHWQHFHYQIFLTMNWIKQKDGTGITAEFYCGSGEISVMVLWPRTEHVSAVTLAVCKPYLFICTRQIYVKEPLSRMINLNQS